MPAKRIGLRAILTDAEIVAIALEACTNDALTPAQAALADRAWDKMLQSDYRAENRLARPCCCQSLAARSLLT